MKTVADPRLLVALAAIFALGMVLATPGQAAKKPLQVSSGGYHSCALKPGGKAVCWGRNEEGQTTVPNMKFKVISAGGWHTCGLKNNGKAVCWGGDSYGETSPPTKAKFRTVSAGYFNACGVRNNGRIACWGYNSDGQSSLNTSNAKFKSVDAGEYHTCGVKTSGKVVCVGGNDYGERIPPKAKFKSVDVGYYLSCGIKTNSKLKCWGYDGDNVVGGAPGGKLRSVSIYTSGSHACGVRRNGKSIVCWGSNTWGQSTVPKSLK